MGIAALILGIMGLVLSGASIAMCSIGGVLVTGVLSLISLILGIVGMVAGQKSEVKKGKGAAITGLVLGSIGLVQCLLALVTLPSIRAYQKDAEEVAARMIISTAETAMESYRAKHSMKVPPEDEWVEALTGGYSPYIQGGPDGLNDPWGTQLRFKRLSQKGDFEIRSAGPDGKFDTEDDITNKDSAGRW